MTAHPNPDTCAVGFDRSPCPACWHAQRVAQSDNHLRREVSVWLAEATETLSRWIDAGNAHRDPEAIAWGRITKIGEEFGEAFPPLTADDFNDGCGYTYRGVSICEDEDGSWIYAFGHIDPALFVEVVHDFDAEMMSDSEERHELTDVQHRWATVVRPPSDPDGSWIEWADANTAETPNAFALTVVSR